MDYKQLGKSDLRVSEVSFGCMSLGEDHADNKELLHKALDRGINFFDTADLYQKGLNESSVGKAFKGMRDRVIIATKVGNRWRDNGSGWDWDPRKSYIFQEVEKSLERLQTDYIDLYQLHGGTVGDPIDETIEAFELLKQQGKIRHYGISSIRPNVIREYVRRAGIVSVMMQYSLLDNRPGETCLDLLHENNIGVLARGSLAKGLLIGKTPAGYLQYSREEVSAAADAVRLLAKAKQCSSTAVTLRYVLRSPAVVSAVTGIRTHAQLSDIIQAVNTPPELSPQEISQLRQSVRPFYYESHR